MYMHTVCVDLLSMKYECIMVKERAQNRIWILGLQLQYYCIYMQVFLNMLYVCAMQIDTIEDLLLFHHLSPIIVPMCPYLRCGINFQYYSGLRYVYGIPTLVNLFTMHKQYACMYYYYSNSTDVLLLSNVLYTQCTEYSLINLYPPPPANQNGLFKFQVLKPHRQSNRRGV